MAGTRGPGQPQYEPTEADRNTVKSMAACGFRQSTIAECIGTAGISEKTLRKHFKRELKVSANMANAAIANKLFQAASEGQAWAICFWLKTRAGFREITRNEVGGIDGAPIQQRHRVEYVDGPKLLESPADAPPSPPADGEHDA